MTFDEYKSKVNTWWYKNHWYAEFWDPEYGRVYFDYGNTEEQAVDTLWEYLVDELGF